MLPGWFVAGERWEGCAPTDDRRRLALRTVAGTCGIRGAAACSASAAVLADLPVWTTPERACLTVTPGSTAHGPSAHVHRAELPPDEIVGRTVRRTSSARTVCDVAREHGVLEAVVVGDAALHERMTDAARLSSALAGQHGWAGVARAREAVALLDGRAESPAESVSRLRLGGWRIAEPDLQTVITDLRGTELGRVDFYWDEFGVAGEVDGRLKYRDRPDAAFFGEKRRQERIEDTGLIVVRWGVADLVPGSDLPDRLTAAFARGSLRPGSERGWQVRSSPRVRDAGSSPS